ncbi:NAD(P)/FAD-dependent oxidoreductase [Alteromonas sediminis]|uniref:NAD(P)/FAD-dependent oxidoreductase n=1 Tax=Alteromonas sediminis TaxID=2259342 RepID=A0A3N5XXW2_9ALTE|nr:NAD(P)/FAD-dependent oxidoreductase [Alteromonas sediminis]RPJ65370.1 NAD(P)/FAD-dependent oxidoreductase [Alteromonas sediminis]
MIERDVIVIGAGAAGLFCAAEAGKRGRRVEVLDNAKKVGRKILISGGGRCNFTNMYASPANFLSQNPHFCKSALSRYTQWDFIALVEKYGIPYHEKTLGQLFCDNSAKDIVAMLLAECEQSNVVVTTRTEILRVEKSGTGYHVETSKGLYHCESLVIASGGLSMPKLGATPFGYQLATQFGLSIEPTRAALVPFTLHDHDKAVLAEISGVSVDVYASCNDTGFREQMLFTHRGLSGPSILQISSFWEPGNTLQINLIPDSDAHSLVAEWRIKNRESLLSTCLSEFFPKRLTSALMQINQWENKPVKQYTSNELACIADSLNEWQLKPNGTEGYRTAEVTLGGVSTGQLSSKTMMAKDVNGLYFIGEVVDVTGWLGGYNFQWAWSSGWAAGQVV